MNTDLLTTRSREVLADAISTATTAGNGTVEPAHLLASLLTVQGSTAPELLRSLGADPAAIAAQVKTVLDRFPRASGSTVAKPQLSQALALKGIEAGVQLLRVHDVAETVQAARVWRGLRDQALVG